MTEASFWTFSVLFSTTYSRKSLPIPVSFVVC